MRNLTGIFAVYLALAGAAEAQNPGAYRGHGYAFIAPVPTVDSFGPQTSAQVGIGGERYFYKGIGLGVESGLVFPWSHFSNGVFALGSANLAYRFPLCSKTLEPFVTAGYSIFVRAGTQNGSNAGAGINLWLKEKVGLRFEIREYIGVVRAHHLGPRIGITFR